MEMDLGKWIFASSVVISLALVYPPIQARMDLKAIASRMSESLEKEKPKPVAEKIDALKPSAKSINIAKANGMLQKLKFTANEFTLRNGRLPKDMDELAASSGGTIEYLPQDPWGFPYIMQHKGDVVVFKSEGLENALKN